MTDTASDRPPVEALVRGLVPAGDAAGVLERAFLSREQLEGPVCLLGPGPTAWGVAQAARALTSVEDTFASVPDLPRSAIALSLEALMLDLLAALGGSTTWGISPRFVPPMAREAARLSVPFGDVVRSMRTTQSLWITALFADLGADAAAPGVAARLAQGTSRVLDDEIGRFLQTYLAEREALLESEVARRRDLVAALLRGDLTAEPDTRHHVLGIDLQRFHTAVVVTREPGAPGLDTRRLGQLLQSAVAGATILALPAGDNLAWAWVSTRHEPTEADQARIRRQLGSLPGARSAVGAPAAGASGFRETHRQAQDATALIGGDRTVGVDVWRDHALAALLGLDEARARSFVRQVLGPLCADDDATREQRLTLRAYLDHGHSLRHVAAARNVHRNTVVYRLKRIEQLLGHPPADNELELRCALLLSDGPGPDLLR